MCDVRLYILLCITSMCKLRTLLDAPAAVDESARSGVVSAAEVMPKVRVNLFMMSSPEFMDE